jgi:hypothetical protein
MRVNVRCKMPRVNGRVGVEDPKGKPSCELGRVFPGVR